MDEIILNSIDFTKIYKPKLICFEIHDPFKYSDRSSFNNLRKNGYKHLFTSGISWILFSLNDIQLNLMSLIEIDYFKFLKIIFGRDNFIYKYF